jgi:hypothetical protein
MSDEVQSLKPDQSPTTGQPAAPSAAPADFESDDLSGLIAQITANPQSAAAYLKRLRQESAQQRLKAKDAQTAAERLAQLEAERKAQDEAAMKEQGKWKELATQREQELARHQQEADSLRHYREAFEAQLKRRIEELPQEQRDLVPDLGDPIKTLEWLDRAEQQGLIGRAKREVPAMDAGAGKKVDPKEVARQAFLQNKKPLVKF